MKDTSLLEKILGKFLSHEQIAALTEEISKGVSLVNGVIDKNEKVKAKKEFVVETFKSIDRMIAQSNKIPATFKLFYDTAKVKIHELIEPIITGMVMENDFSNLDDIPDVKKNENPHRPENAERPQANMNNQQPNGEQGGRRRRNRRHGRNRNNNQNQNQEPVQTLHETSLQKPEPKPTPKPEPKPVETSPETSHKPKTAETFQETSLPEAKKPARKGRAPKKPEEKPAPEPKPDEKKPARRGRTPRKPKETNE